MLTVNFSWGNYTLYFKFVLHLRKVMSKVKKQTKVSCPLVGDNINLRYQYIEDNFDVYPAL